MFCFLKGLSRNISKRRPPSIWEKTLVYLGSNIFKKEYHDIIRFHYPKITPQNVAIDKDVYVI